MHLESHQVFRTVVDSGSITKAAQVLHMTQSTASRHLQALEDEYAGLLFERGTSGLTLTPLGKALYPYSCDLLNCQNRAKEELLRLRNESGSLCVGASLSIGEYMLPQILGEFQTRHSNAEIRMRVSNTEQIVHDLINHRIDVGMVEGMVEKHADLMFEPWRPDELVLVCSAVHPFTHFETVQLTDLIGEPLLMREEGSGTRQVTELALERAGVLSSLTIAMELGSTQAIKSAIEAGLGIAFLSKWTVQTECESRRLAVIAVEGFAIRRLLHVVQRTERYPKVMVQELLHMLKQLSL